MSNAWLDKWNERYRQQAYAFGTEPNLFFQQQLQKLSVGKMLLPAEGEGRNAVYAAVRGWQAFAFDISDEGKKKAELLANARGVTLDYQVGELSTLTYQPNEFDALALIYAHFPAEIKSTYHKKLNTLLRSGGIVIFEAFSKKHIDFVNKNPNVGGPRDVPTLFSIEEIQNDFSNFEILKLSEEEIELNEGLYHVGVGSVIRFVGRKK